MKHKFLILLFLILLSSNLFSQSRTWKVFATYPYFENSSINGQFEIGIEKGLTTISKSGKIGLNAGLAYRQFNHSSNVIPNIIPDLGIGYIYMFVQSYLNLSVHARGSIVFEPNNLSSFGLNPSLKIEYIRKKKYGAFCGYEYFNQDLKSGLTNRLSKQQSHIINLGVKYIL